MRKVRYRCLWDEAETQETRDRNKGMKSQDRKYQHKQGETTWPRPHAGPHMVPKAYEYSLKPSQNRMFLNEKDQPTNRLCLMHYPPTVATFRSWRGSVACIAQNLLAGKKNSEREGFEPSIPLLVYTPSKGAPSTTRTPLHGRSIALHEKIRGIGERGIRTLGTGKPVHWISSPAPSTTRTSLQAINLYMRLRRFELPTLSSANWYSIQLSYSLIM